MVGLTFAKAFARGRDLPLVGVNHLEGHLYSVDLSTPAPPRPFLSLIVSGGHTQLVRVDADFHHEILGQTRDDAAGEAFDKVAQLLDLGYPGGPAIDRLAREGDATFHDFPRTRLDDNDFSFSGLKTSVLYYLRDLGEEKDAFLRDHRADLCASFQQAIVDVLVGAVRDAARDTGVEHVAIVGGVSANSALRSAVRAAGEADGFDVYMPEMAYCMDNAAMIARAGAMRLQAGDTAGPLLDIQPRLDLTAAAG
jgi:N6-L-threonylcarbamoyladenine synthase